MLNDNESKSTQDPLGEVWDKELEPVLKQEPKLNQQCQQKYEQEKSHLQSLPKYRIPDDEILLVNGIRSFQIR